MMGLRAGQIAGAIDMTAVPAGGPPLSNRAARQSASHKLTTILPCRDKTRFSLLALEVL